MPSQTLILWRLLDGKPGHEKQTLGLAKAMARMTAVEIIDIKVGNRWHDAYHWLKGDYPAGDGLPPPDLVLSAGHGTHFAGLAARRAHGGKLLVIMKPSLPAALFDLCLIPEHDTPPIRANVIATRGSINAVQTGGAHHPSAGLILIGGPSEHYAWDEGSVLRQISHLVDRLPDIQWRLSTSRRTPRGFIERLRESANLELISHEHTPPGWIESALGQADQVWVTEDSVSMLYEALTAGCHVGLLRLSRFGPGRVARGIDALLAEGWITTMEGWQAGVCPAPPHVTFNEAERCARAVLDKWFARVD
jgi:mitochondrial fission protein ELM1